MRRASGPDQITAGPDGALWFTEARGNKIGRITTEGAITEFALPGPNSGPTGVVEARRDAHQLNEDEAGKVHAEGDHAVQAAKVTRDGLVPDPRFRLDFDTAFATGPARPHGVAFK